MTPLGETSMTRPAHEYQSIPFDKLRAPGCYVSRNTGTLYRVPAEALAGGPNAAIRIVSKDGMLVTKIAEDPWVPINIARRLCAAADVYPNF
ncbi:MAG TPA: hypothetical protein VMV94_18050 [Phycisphaerae bacterium]|nr:hypothetical protein [Phycisphaerae bacterium]